MNKAITNINKENQHLSPDLNIDLYRTSNRQQRTYQGSKQSDRHGKTKSRRLYNISLLFDGIHPIKQLAKAWLMKITIHLARDCWGSSQEIEQDINNNITDAMEKESDTD